jgi:hypothetical protein
MRLECLTENSHHIPLKNVSLSSCIRPIHQSPESRLETWICCGKVVFHGLENKWLINNCDSVMVNDLDPTKGAFY